jgi:hypothetical protein
MKNLIKPGGNLKRIYPADGSTRIFVASHSVKVR